MNPRFETLFHRRLEVCLQRIEKLADQDIAESQKHEIGSITRRIYRASAESYRDAVESIRHTMGMGMEESDEQDPA